MCSICSVVCKNYYPHGNLQQFLKTRIHQLTEVGIHKLTLDVANGLDFIHTQGIVHNTLNTKCVYMASVSEVYLSTYVCILCTVLNQINYLKSQITFIFKFSNY